MAILILKCGWRQKSSERFAVLAGISPHKIWMIEIELIRHKDTPVIYFYFHVIERNSWKYTVYK